jgi:hypothetical protein
MVAAFRHGPGLRNLYEARFALIRPDQHVAWRGDHILEAGAMLRRAAGHVPTNAKEATP